MGLERAQKGLCRSISSLFAMTTCSHIERRRALSPFRLLHTTLLLVCGAFPFAHTPSLNWATCMFGRCRSGTSQAADGACKLGQAALGVSKLGGSRGCESCPRKYLNEGGVKKHRGLKCRAARQYTQGTAMLRFLTLTRCRQLLAPIGGDRDRCGTIAEAGSARRVRSTAGLWRGVTDGLW